MFGPMPAPAIQTIPRSGGGAQRGVRCWHPRPWVGLFSCVNGLTRLFLASYHRSSSSLAEMIRKEKRAQSQTLCSSNLPVARARCSWVHSGLLEFPAISSSLRHSVPGKHRHQAQQAVSRIPSSPRYWERGTHMGSLKRSSCYSLHVWEEQPLPQANNDMTEKQEV